VQQLKVVRCFFLWERRRRESLRSFPSMFLCKGSTWILRRSLTVLVSRRGKNASAYRTGSEAQPLDTTESFKDSYRNIIAGALNVRLDHFFLSR
jgi:hypothetical protein